MNQHLSSETFVDALDGAMTPGEAAHLAACARCRAELDEMRQLLADAGEAGVPEPSPLFWHHFPRRVREATGDLAAPPVGGWLRRWALPGAAATAVAVLAFALIVPREPGSDERTVDARSVWALPPLADDDGFWGLVAAMAADLDPVDVQWVTAAAGAAADLMIEELSGEQRMELARLLQQEMGES